MATVENYLKNELYSRFKEDNSIFEFLQEGSLDGIWYWDIEAPENEWMSPRFWLTLGFDPAGKKHLASEWQEIIFKEDLKIALDNFSKHCKDPNHPYDQVVRYRHKNGSVVWVRCRGLAIRDKAGKPVRFLGAHTDITIQKTTEEALRSKSIELENTNKKLSKALKEIKTLIALYKTAEKELQRSNEELEQFVYVASHDLKSPLKGIITLASWIQEDLGDALTGESAENFKLLRSRVKRMDTLLDGILTYSLASRENLNSHRVNLNDIIKALVAELNIPNGFKIKITNKLPSVMAPKSTFEQIFSNLINNAFKHHDKKSGTITISAKDAGEFWEFLVTDDGPGIAPKYQDLIFKRFQTLQSRDDVEGSGLGLSIVKKLVVKQGGEIFVDSKEGQRGTTFRFTWKK